MMAAGNYRRDVAILDCPEWEDLVWMWSCGLSLLSASLQRFIIYPSPRCWARQSQAVSQIRPQYQYHDTQSEEQSSGGRRWMNSGGGGDVVGTHLNLL